VRTRKKGKHWVDCKRGDALGIKVDVLERGENRENFSTNITAGLDSRGRNLRGKENRN